MSPLKKRLVTGDGTLGDREWMEYLDAFFRNVSFEALTDLGLNQDDVREFLGVISLHRRPWRADDIRPDAEPEGAPEKPAPDERDWRSEAERLRRENEAGHKARLEMGKYQADLIARINELSRARAHG